MNIDELIQAKPWWSPHGMLGDREALMCYHLTRDAFQGLGAVVDAGSFLGKSAFHLAQGLRLNSIYDPKRDRVQCFDNFLVNEPHTADFIATYFGQRLSMGDSTRTLFDSQVEPVRGMLDVYAGDFHTVQWKTRPIEVLFVDIAKSSTLSGRVAELFYPNLIPGVSLVIHQDYHHPWLPHIHVTMEHLAEYFELIIPRVDDSAVFRFRAPIPEGVLLRAIRYDFTPEEQIALMDRAIARLSTEDRLYVELARIVLQLYWETNVDLERELDDVARRFETGGRTYSANPYVSQVRKAIRERAGWRSISEHQFERALEIADGLLPENPSTHLMTMRGEALLGLKRYREAELQLRAAVQVRPPSGFAYVDMARALIRQGRLREAEEQLLTGVRDRGAQGTEPHHFFDLLSDIWRAGSPPADCRATVDRLHAEFSDSPDVWALDAQLHGLLGDLGNAKISLDKAAQLGLDAGRVQQLRERIRIDRPARFG